MKKDQGCPMLKVSLFDQERKLFEDLATQINLPGEEGEFVVLEFHAPMISLLKAGQIHVDGKYLSISQGIAMVNRNELFILVER